MLHWPVHTFASHLSLPGPAAWPSAADHAFCALLFASAALAAWRMRRIARLEGGERWRERRMREELEAYARLDLAELLSGAAADSKQASRTLARTVCRSVAEKSLFGRVGFLLRNAEGRLFCAGSVGMDDLTVQALEAWGETLVAEERGGSAGSGGPIPVPAQQPGQSPGQPAGHTVRQVRSGARSFGIGLGPWHHFDHEVDTWVLSGKHERRQFRRAIVAPIRLRTGRMAGALAVCTDGVNFREGVPSGNVERAMGPIESLAARLGTALENETLNERLLRAEKLAGLGQLAGGVAHALNNPLTAVLGFAGLIAESAADPRLRKDAETIRAEALKMKDTVQRLLDFWRPATRTDEPVELLTLLHELERACRPTLQTRGVDLLIQAEAGLPTIRGNRDRLRQVLEHLLNNSAQAIASSPTPIEEKDEPHAIRLTLSHDDRALHLIVSDTGPGFREPGRVFDPFYTTRGPEQGAGLGLSICYGIIREHGGEISAFNLHPRGAAVVLELPLRKTMHTPADTPSVLLEESA